MNVVTINLDAEFNLIKNFENSLDAPFYFCKEGYFYIFSKADKYFIIKTNKKPPLARKEFRFHHINNLKLDADNCSITILDSRLKSTEPFFSFEVYKFSLNNLKEDNKYFYRLFLPKKTRKIIRFDWYFSREFFLCINNRLWRGICFKICDFRFNVFDFEEFMVIECDNSEVEFSKFDYYCRFILAAIGFITGYAPMDEGYYFGYKKLGSEFEGAFYVSNFVGTYDSFYSVVTTNSYEFFSNLDINDEVQKKIERIEEKLSPVRKDIFENFCRKITDDEEFGEIIFLLLYVNNKYSKVNLYLQGVTLSVILEMLSSKICNENKKSIVPIKDKHLARKLKAKLHKCAREFFEKYKNKTGDYEHSPIKKRIDNINQFTNRDKLIKSFEIIGLKLTKRDKEVINKRNNFLHGNVPIESLEPSQIPKLFYYVLRLNLLIQALILKYFGFSGVVKNLPKIFLDYILELNEYLEDEEYYREI